MPTNPTGPGVGEVSGEDPLPPPVVSDLLASSRRRQLLEVLYGETEPLPVEDLAARITAAETGTDPASVDRETCRAVRTDLYQRHLPKLTATGVVNFDSMLATVEFVGDPGLTPRLQSAPRSEPGSARDDRS